MLEKKLFNKIYEQVKKVHIKIGKCYVRSIEDYYVIYCMAEPRYILNTIKTDIYLIHKGEHNYSRGFEIIEGKIANEIKATKISYKITDYHDKTSLKLVSRICDPKLLINKITKGIITYNRKDEWESLQNDIKLFNKKLPKDLIKYANTRINHYLFFENIGKTSKGKCSFCSCEVNEKLIHNTTRVCNSCNRELEVINMKIKKTNIIKNYEFWIFDKINNNTFTARYVVVRHESYDGYSNFVIYEHERELFKNNTSIMYELGCFSQSLEYGWVKFKLKPYYINTIQFRESFIYKQEKIFKSDKKFQYIFEHKMLAIVKSPLMKMRVVATYYNVLMPAIKHNNHYLVKCFSRFKDYSGNIELYANENYDKNMIELNEALINTKNSNKGSNTSGNDRNYLSDIGVEWIDDNIRWLSGLSLSNLNEIMKIYKELKESKKIGISITTLLTGFRPLIDESEEWLDNFKFLTEDNYLKYIPFKDIDFKKITPGEDNHLVLLALINPNLLEMSIKLNAFGFLKSLKNHTDYILNNISKKILFNGVKKDYDISKIFSLNIIINNYESDFNKACNIVERFKSLDSVDIKDAIQTDEIIYVALEERLGINNILKYLENQKKVNENASNLYRDYIDMALDLKLDLNDSRILFPKNVKIVHDDANKKVLLLPKDRYDKRFLKRVKTMLKYEKEEGDFKIEIPKSFKEIQKEGNIMNNCIGGYYGKIAKVESDVLFLRRKDDDGEWKPFADIEIESKLNTLRQMRVKKDISIIDYVKKEESDLSKFIKKYCDEHNLYF